MREVVRMPDNEFELYRRLPAWPARVSAAHTITREIRATEQGRWDAAAAVKVTGPVLLLVGGDTTEPLKRDPNVVAAALLDARVNVHQGQQHIAIDLIPEVFAELVKRFVHSGLPSERRRGSGTT